MVCNNCGNQVPEGTAFCPNCGSQINAEAAAPTPAPAPAVAPTPAPAPAPQPYGQKPDDGKGMSIAALVLGICGIVLFWWPVANVIVLVASILGIVFGVQGRKKSIATYGKASGMATAGLVLGIIGTAICGIGVLSCTVCVSCLSCGANSAMNSLNNSIYW